MDSSRQAATQEPAPAKRQPWTIKQKRQIVEETLVPGASVAKVAR
jgi:transposase-like protein